jgi:hypothetical protein
LAHGHRGALEYPRRLAGAVRARVLAERRSTTVARGVAATIESMNGARFIHDTLECAGWDVEIAGAVKASGVTGPIRRTTYPGLEGAGCDDNPTLPP